MDFIKDKSEFNIEAARELIKLSIYAPSVHCAYYGCFQYMKFMIKERKNITYEKIESDCNIYNGGGGTHGYIIDNILIELRIKIKNTEEYINIKRKIKDLKAFRIKSDYFNSQILYDDADKCIKFSEEIIKTLKKNL
jgi:hypothetical protein